MPLKLEQQHVAPHGTPPKWDLQRTALANNSDFFTSASAPMPTASGPVRSITPGPRTTSNQSPDSTPKKWNTSTYKSNVKSIKKENIITLTPCRRHVFFLRVYGWFLEIKKTCKNKRSFWPDICHTLRTRKREHHRVIKWSQNNWAKIVRIPPSSMSSHVPRWMIVFSSAYLNTFMHIDFERGICYLLCFSGLVDKSTDNKKNSRRRTLIRTKHLQPWQMWQFWKDTFRENWEITVCQIPV